MTKQEMILLKPQRGKTSSAYTGTAGFRGYIMKSSPRKRYTSRLLLLRKQAVFVALSLLLWCLLLLLTIRFVTLIAGNDQLMHLISSFLIAGFVIFTIVVLIVNFILLSPNRM